MTSQGVPAVVESIMMTTKSIMTPTMIADFLLEAFDHARELSQDLFKQWARAGEIGILPKGPKDIMSDNTPDGWKYLGSGVSRHVFLCPDGWVYKVGYTRDNDREIKHAQRLFMESDSTIRFPWAESVPGSNTHSIASVIRMEYVENTMTEELPGSLSSGFMKLRNYIEDVAFKNDVSLYDTHRGNIIFSNGVPVMIDMAS